MKQFNIFRGLAIALMLICFNAVWAYDIKVDGIYYNIISTTDLTVEVTKGDNKYSGEVIIPVTVSYKSKTLTVTSIGEDAFYNCDSLTSVIIGNSVTSIGDGAFCGCTGLTSIAIPNSVTSIGYGAFGRCTSLKNLQIEDGETTLWLEPNNYFTGGGGGKGLFYYCPLETIYLGRNLLYDVTYAHGFSPFYGIKSLKSVTIGYCVTSIKSNAFSYCTGLTSIVVEEGNKKYDSRNNCNAIIETNTNTLVAGCKNTIIPNSVTSIGNYAFYYCSGIKIIYLLGELPPTVKNNNFTKSQYIDITVYVPIGSLKTYQNADVWKEFWEIKEYSVYNKVTYIVDGETYATDSIAFGDSIVLIDAPTKKGYTFSGWSGVPSTMPPHDITIEGTFSVNTYTVTYVVDGDVYARDSVAYGSEVVLRDEPVKEGLTFSGWSEAPETMPAEDIAIEGTFIVNSYIVTFMLDGEVYETATVEYGTEIELPTVPEKEGYEFSGWMNVPVTMPANDIIIEGNYIADTAIGQVYVGLEKNEVYNLKGLRVTETNKLTRGIYIINGKKVLLK